MPQRSTRWALVGLTLALPAAATVVVAQTIEEMTASSNLVVHGTVGQVQAAWNDQHTGIWTFAEVTVKETLKGQAAPGTSVMIRNPGGELKEIGSHVAGSPQFTPGEEVIVFLEAAADTPNLWVVNAMSAGKITLAADHFGKLRATRDLSGLGLYRRAPGAQPKITTTDKPEDLGPAEQFLTRVRTAATQVKR